MRPLPFVWPYAMLFWAAYCWAYWPELGIIRRAQRSGNEKDAKSLQVIVFGMWIAFVGAYPLAWVRAVQFPVHRVSIFFNRYRMAVEERAMLAAIGEPYKRFMRTRKRLVPFIY